MLSDKEAVATVAVKNLETARTFYEKTLGLTKVMENPEVLTFRSGNSMLFVYRSQYGRYQQSHCGDVGRRRGRRLGEDAEGPRSQLRAL